MEIYNCLQTSFKFYNLVQIGYLVHLHAIILVHHNTHHIHPQLIINKTTKINKIYTHRNRGGEMNTTLFPHTIIKKNKTLKNKTKIRTKV